MVGMIRYLDPGGFRGCDLDWDFPSSSMSDVDRRASPSELPPRVPNTHSSSSSAAQLTWRREFKTLPIALLLSGR